jgi:hypothetical protein
MHKTQIIPSADDLLQAIRDDAVSAYAERLAAKIDDIITQLIKLRDKAKKACSHATVQPKPANIRGSGTKTAARVQRERDHDIVYEVLTDEWKETKYIYNRARAGGLSTEDGNCLKILRKFEEQGLVQLDPHSPTHRWRKL